MIRHIFLTIIIVVLTNGQHAHAFLGHAAPGAAMADYDPATGRMSVSVNGVNNWFIQSISDSLTGDAPLNLPAVGGLVSDNDEIIGEVTFRLFGYTDLDLGNVAAVGLPLNDLTISWNAGLGAVLQTQPVVYSFDPNGMTNVQPAVQLDSPDIIDIGVDPLNLTLDASGTTDDGAVAPLTYEWDLDDNGAYEIDSGTTPTLDIANVVTTFGGPGDHPVGVRVFDGEFFTSARRIVSIVGIIPEPTTLVLATFSLLAVACRPRSRRRH